MVARAGGGGDIRDAALLALAVRGGGVMAQNIEIKCAGLLLDIVARGAATDYIADVGAMAKIARLAREMRRAEQLAYRDAFNASVAGAAYLRYAVAYDALTAALDAPATEAPLTALTAAIRALLAAVDVTPGPYYNVRVRDPVNAAKALLALGGWVAQ